MTEPVAQRDELACIVEALEATKRRAYQLAVALITVVVAFNFATREPGDVVLTYVYPSGAVLLLAALPLVRSRRVPLRAIEWGLLAVGASVVLVGLVDLLFVAEPFADQLLGLTGAQYWALNLLMLFGFVLFDRQLGLRFGVLVLGVSLLLALVALGLQHAAGALTTQMVVYLVRVHVFMAILLVVVYLVAGLREQLHRAIERAELLRSRALTDPLTGLANRYSAEERLQAEASEAVRRARPLSVAMLDIDHFKRVNDELGHDVGDQVLSATARLLRTGLRPRDLAARWGGEEFLLVLPEADLEQATAIAERCRRAIAAGRPGGRALTVTLGVAEREPDEEPGSLIRRADMALYEGKRTGRDRVIAAPPPSSDPPPLSDPLPVGDPRPVAAPPAGTRPT